MITFPLTPVPRDDSELLQLAATPRTRLFPGLNRASAFTPLMMVCCVLPAFLLLAKPALNEEAALWGLRSLAAANATTFSAILKPGLNETGQPLIYQPPLCPWLNSIVMRVVGPSHPLATSLVSIVATAFSIWLITRLAWRIGGANTSLIAALLTCTHPQVLEAALAPGNGPVGACLLLMSVFGFQRHLEGKQAILSTNLVICGVAWGLSLLTVGPVAFSLILVFAICSLIQHQKSTLPTSDGASTSPAMGRWPAFRSTLILAFVGLVVGSWWEVMMLWSHGRTFWCSWWTSLPAECLAQGNTEWHCDLRPLLQPSCREWVMRNALLIGWLVVGVERSWHESRRGANWLTRQRYQLLLLWWIITLSGRMLAEAAGMLKVTNTGVWDLALLSPSVLLAAVGFGSLIDRNVSRRGEFFLVILLVDITVWRLTMSSLTGLTAAAATAIFLVCGPMLVRSPGRNLSGWTETGWRRLLQITVYGALGAYVVSGMGLRSPATPDADRLTELASRLATLPEVCRISLIATRDPVPVTLRHLLRSRWPQAQMVATEGWDAGLTRAMDDEAARPHSRFLILEWTSRDIRVSADTGRAWQITAVGNPMRFHGRRLSMVLIAPRGE